MAEQEDALVFEEGGPRNLSPEDIRRRRFLLLLTAGVLSLPAAFILGENDGSNAAQIAMSKQQEREHALLAKAVTRAQEVARSVSRFVDGDIKADVQFEQTMSKKTDEITSVLYDAISQNRSLAENVSLIGSQLNNFGTLRQQLFGYVLLAPLIEDNFRQTDNRQQLINLSFTDGLVKTTYASSLTVQADAAQRDPELTFLRQQLATYEGRRLVTIPPFPSTQEQVKTGLSLMVFDRVLRPAMGK